MLFERRRFLHRQRNRFFQHAEAEYFLAWRENRVAGRITAHVDRHFNEFQEHDWGMVGFFECEEDPEAAAALLAAAERWAAAEGACSSSRPLGIQPRHDGPRPSHPAVLVGSCSCAAPRLLRPRLKPPVTALGATPFMTSGT